ncbi:hypothetical protein U0070_005256 [Myodes glareolus]|uniref:Uncharacterized protein n=1 Tax=Myodes glareolus TaxID=447135 RepID=A0AAW0H524_MYOGA
MPEMAQAELKERDRRCNPVTWLSGGLKKTKSVAGEGDTGTGTPGRGGAYCPYRKTRIGKQLGGPDLSRVGVATAVRFGGGTCRNLGPSWKGKGLKNRTWDWRIHV